MKRSLFPITGFSLTEIIVAVSLFLLLASIGVGAYFKYYTVSLYNADVNGTLTLLGQARFQALKNATNANIGVHLDRVKNSLTVFTNTYNAASPSNHPLSLDYLTITALQLNPAPGTTAEILFQKQTGKTVNSGTFTLSKGSFSFPIAINTQGVID